MSRVAKNPVKLPEGVSAEFKPDILVVKGPLGENCVPRVECVEVTLSDGVLTFSATGSDPCAIEMSGTLRALTANAALGVSRGFERRLRLVGVGYRAQASGKLLHLSLGYSHPVIYGAPDGIEVETPSQNEIVLRGIDKQVVGQEAAKIRALRPPEPYKGKGVRYADENVVIKETKKK